MEGGLAMKEKFTRWFTLFVEYLKRDWKLIIFWIIGLGFFSAAFVPAFIEIVKGEGLLGMYETLQNPAMTSMVGPTPVEYPNNYTLGAMYSHMMFLYSGLFSMIVSVIHVIRHTRKEEDLGLSELIRSFQVGRQANSLAVMMELLFINILLSVFIALVMISFDAASISIEGAFLFGGSVGAAGLIGGVIALVFAQIMPTSSSATGSSLGLIGFLYLIRAGTDISNVNWSMLNPFGWTYLTYPFTENNWSPLIYLLFFVLIMLVLAFALEGARDMGAGYLPESEGRKEAKQSLLSIPGLFFRLNKGIIISWFVAFVFLGAAYGSIYGDMQAFLESNEMLKQMFTHTGVSIEESFTEMIILVLVLLVTILPVSIINSLFTKEKKLYFSQIYGTKVTRSQLYWTNILLGIMVSLIGVLFVAGGLGEVALRMMDDSAMELLDFLKAGYNLFPSVLFFISLAALALGWFPQIGNVVYIYLVYSFLLNYFEGILDLPKWLLKTTPQSWLAQMPTEAFELNIFLIMTTVSIGLIFIGSIGYKQRDILEGA